MSREPVKQSLRPPASGMFSLNIASEINRLKSAAEWQSTERHAVSLVKDTSLNILLMVLKRGARLHEHRTKGPIALQVVAGSIRFKTDAERLVSAGEMIALDRNIAHSLEAVEESAILLTTAMD